MHLPSLLIAAAVLVLANADSDVLDLTKDNFDSLVLNEPIILVEFYAPWCGHCKTLAPQYETAATALKKLDPPVPLAKVDATVESELAGKYGVSGYPTLKIFRNGVPADYNGPREADGIISYMTKQAQPSSYEIKTEEDLKTILDTTDYITIGYFPKETKLYKQFIKAANEARDDYRFAHTFVEALGGSDYNNDIVIYQPKHLHNKFEKSIRQISSSVSMHQKTDAPEIKAFVRNVVTGLVGVITPATKALYPLPVLVTYIKNIDIKNNLSGFKYFRNRLLKIADQVGQVKFAIASKEDFPNDMKEFGLSGDVVAAIHGVDNEKYSFKGKWTPEAIEQFARDLLAGSLTPYIKSEAVPVQSGPVTVVVGKTFKQIVDEPGKDVLLEFYAPWCGHCKSLSPKYDELAEKLKDRSDIVIAKIDATANDFPPYFKVQGYPSIYWVPAKHKSMPLKYEGPREVKDFLEYIEKQATVPFKAASVLKSKGKKSKKSAKDEL